MEKIISTLSILLFQSLLILYTSYNFIILRYLFIIMIKYKKYIDFSYPKPHQKENINIF